MKNPSSNRSPLVLTLADDRRLPLKMAMAVTLVAGVFGGFSSLAHAAPLSAPDFEYAKGRILIEARAGLSPADLDKILSVHGGKASKIGQSNLHIVTLPGNASEKAVIAQLAHNPHLRFAELDRRFKVAATPNDPYFGAEWHLAKIGAPAAWDTTAGAGVTIAILDTGVDGTHPDLAGNMVPGWNLIDNNNNSTDICGHGTMVAGTAAATFNNGVGVTGGAGQAKIMPIRVAYFDTTYNSCMAYASTIASGITYAADHGARIASSSFAGIAGSSAAQSAGNYMKSKGGLVFIAAGNNGIDENLPAITSMVVVSATDENDNKTGWSSYGNFVALSAPGNNINTTTMGGGYAGVAGTSFSTPLTASVAALMMSAKPSLDGSQIEKLMYSTAADLGAAGRDAYYGYGRVDAAAAVKAVVGTVVTLDTQAPTAAITAPQANSTATGLMSISVNAADNVGVSRVELQVNGTVVAVDNTGPFGFSWDSTGTANGSAALVAIAYDAAGNATASAPVYVNVSNYTATVARDTTPPVVNIANPVTGTVTGNVSVTVHSSDNGGNASVSDMLYIDGVLKAKGTGASLSYNWNTRKLASGVHTIQAVAKDAAGNTSSTTTQVTVK